MSARAGGFSAPSAAGSGALASRPRSASTIIFTRPVKSTVGVHPSLAFAFSGVPIRRSTSAGRRKRWSSVTCFFQSSPTWPNATSISSRTECVSPVAMT